MGEYKQEQDRLQTDVAETETRRAELSELEPQEAAVPELEPQEDWRESAASHRRNIVRCNRLLLLELFVLASLVIALILSFVLK